MIRKNYKDIGFIYKGTQNIDKVYKGTNLVFEQGYTREQTGVPPIQTTYQTIGKNLKDYKIYGNSVQNGTPTPSNPIEIKSVGERTKNIFDGELEEGSIDSSGNNSTSNTNIRSKNYILIDSNIQYTISNEAGDNIALRFYDSNKQFISAQGATSTPLTFTTPSTAEYFRFVITNDRDLTNKVQVELGNQVSTYEPYGYKIPVIERGKNIFDKLSAELTNCTLSGNTFTVTEDGRTTNIDIKIPAGRYTISAEPTTTIYLRNGKVSSGTIGNISENNKTTIFDFSGDVDGYLRLTFFNKGNSISDIQIEKGTEATSYEPYFTPITTNIYLDEPLRKVGNYADYIDFANGKIVRNIKEYTGNDLEIYNSSNGYLAYRGQTSKAKLYGTGNFISNYFNKAENFNSSDMNKECIQFSRQSDTNFIYVALDENRDKTNFKFYYILETPIEETITLPNIPSIKGTTVFEVDTDINASNMYIKYKGK